MDEKKIQAFLMVVKLGSINKAAERLDYTQPALTQMMNSLERDLGCRLLSRGHGGVKLTREGEALLPLLENVSNSMKKLRKEIVRLTAEQKQYTEEKTGYSLIFGRRRLKFFGNSSITYF